MTVLEKYKAIKIIFNFIHKNFIFTLRPYSVNLINRVEILDLTFNNKYFVFSMIYFLAKIIDFTMVFLNPFHMGIVK
jgi:hypothetical protein